MNAIVKSPFGWLLKREYWEERRGLVWSQVIVAAVLVLVSILGIVVAEATRMRAGVGVSINIGGGDMGSTLQNALAHNAAAMSQGLAGMMWSFGFMAAIVLSFTMFFYLLGALYDDRKDRSILFWKSLPVSDTATVLSKVAMAILVMPVVALVVALGGFIAEQIVASIWFAAHGLNPFTLLWAHTSPYASWLHMLGTLPINAVWALPTVGWLLFCSAAARSKPFLWAVFIPIIAAILNSWIALLQLPHISVKFFWANFVGRALFSIVPASWVSTYVGNGGFTPPTDISAIDRSLGTWGMMYRTLLVPDMWIGAAVGIALIAAAIWFRRWRDEV